MIALASGLRVYLACGVTDMRKGMTGLAMLVQQSLAEDPFGGTVFAFRGRRAGLIKLIWHDGVGLCMLTKRLEQGQFAWPTTSTTGKIALSSAQLAALLDGCEWRTAAQAGTGRINLGWACNKLWHRRGGIDHHWHVQIDPENLPDDPAILQQMLRTLLGQHGELHAEYEKIRLLLSRLTRHQFGRRSEQLTDEQLQLGLEDLQQSIAENQAEQDAAEAARDPKPRHKRPARNHGALPAHLPRYDVVIDDAPESCPCCGGTLHCIGETTSEQLDIVPAQLRVRVTRRPRYACRSCEAAVVVAEAPARPIDGGMPTEALIIHVLISKYCDFLPLYRQSQMLARQGVVLDRSTLCNWVGTTCWWLAPLYDLVVGTALSSPKVFADDTPLPVLDPGRGRTKTGRLWCYAVDDRPWCGPSHPVAAYVYSEDRRGIRPAEHLAQFRGVLQVDGYNGFKRLAGDRADHSVQLAFCWVHYPEPIFMRRRPVSANAGTVIWPTVDRHKTRRIRGSGGRRACQAWASKFPSPLVRGRHGPKRPPWPRASSGDLSRCIAQWWRHRHDQGSRV